jgi:hypothetical protein
MKALKPVVFTTGRGCVGPPGLGNFRLLANIEHFAIIRLTATIEPGDPLAFKAERLGDPLAFKPERQALLLPASKARVADGELVAVMQRLSILTRPSLRQSQVTGKCEIFNIEEYDI